MNIIQRNYFRLLRSGTFGSQEQIEPMSAWKWQQVLSWAKTHGVAALVGDGIRACGDQFFMQLTEAQATLWREVQQQAEQRHAQASGQVAALLALLGTQQLRPILLEPWTTVCHYDVPGHHLVCRVNIYFPFTTQGRKADKWAKANGTDVDGSHRHLLRYRWQSLGVEHRHRMLALSNKFNNLPLQSIIEQEWLEGGTDHVVIGGQRIETVAPTLAMLIALLGIVKAQLHEGLRLWQLADLGIMLRKQGDRVDFVKLQGWIERLHFERMAQLIGLMLTGLLGFSADEVPFMQPAEPDADFHRLVDQLFIDGTQSPFRYFRYSPGESLAGLMSSITRSLGSIEE